MTPARPSRARWGAVVAVAAVVALGVLGAAWATNGASSPTAAPTVRVSTAADLVKAYATATPGTTIELASGVYQPKQLTRSADAPVLSSPVVLRTVAGASVEVRNLDVNGPGLRIDAVRLTGNVRFRARAVGSSVVSSTINPGTVIVEGDNVRVERNLIRAPADRDALDIGATDGSGPSGVQVRNNTIGPGRLTAGSTAHVDCLQVMSATNLVVARNVLYDCPAQTMLVKSDLGPIEGVIIARNSMRGCRPRRDTCPAFMTLQVVPGAHAMRDIQVVGNSVAGAIRATGSIPGVTLTANAMDHLEDGCQYPLVANVAATSRCTMPAGNRLAQPLWLDVDAVPPNLRPAPGSPVRDAGAVSMTPDADGRTTPCGARWDAGAYEGCYLGT